MDCQSKVDTFPNSNIEVMPYYLAITLRRRLPSSIPNLQSHFERRGLLVSMILLIPRPPWLLGEQTSFQVTKGMTLFSFHLSQRKSLRIFSIARAIEVKVTNRDMKYVGRLEMTDLSNISFPPLDKYILFHLANLFWILTKTGFHIYKEHPMTAPNR